MAQKEDTPEKQHAAIVAAFPHVVPPLFTDLAQAGKPRATYANARAALKDLGLRFSWDRFSDRRFVVGEAAGKDAGELSDVCVFSLRQKIIECYSFDPGKENIYDAVFTLCNESEFDPVLDYLNKLRWDGQSRLATLLHYYAGAADTPLNKAIGEAFMVACVRRVRQPGCKFDFFPVLEGPQGSGKTSFLRILAVNPDWYSDQEILHASAREQQEALRGKWIYELGELACVRHTDANKVKNFASRESDRARPAYGRVIVEVPRRCVFIGTTNEATYLSDTTGGRRFWPVRVGEVYLDEMRADRDQLWAEAAAMEAGRAPINIPRELWSDAAEQQAERLEDDPWDDTLAGLRGDSEGRISYQRCWEALGKPSPSDRQKHDQTRLHERMRVLGWERLPKTKPFNENGRTQRGYTRKLHSEV